MLKITIGGRSWLFDEQAQLTMGDIVACREMGADPDGIGAMLRRVATVAEADLGGADRLAVAEAFGMVAYLAAVRLDHELGWKDFVWSLPADAATAVEVVEPAAPAAAPPSVGEAVAAASEPTA